ncbi:MAG: hypothetical protein IJN50_07610 [Clostridia bacterium]|nr:hypothetical protein [Clostridia bacterium]
MKEILNIRKVCNFYVSTTHLTTMMIPFIHKKMNMDINISTFLQYNLNENIEILLSKLILNDNSREEIRSINWNSTNMYKYSNIEKVLKETIKNAKQIMIIVVGDEKRIDFVNQCIERFFDKNSKKIGNKKITIINCYEVSQFNNDMLEILNNHQYILNTSGEHLIEEYFNGYERKQAID